MDERDYSMFMQRAIRLVYKRAMTGREFCAESAIDNNNDAFAHILDVLFPYFETEGFWLSI